MDNLTIDTFLAALARHALTTAAGVVIAHGYAGGATQEQLIGAGMVAFGVALSWWNKRGYALMLQKLRDAHLLSTMPQVVTEPK